MWLIQYTIHQVGSLFRNSIPNAQPTEQKFELHEVIFIIWLDFRYPWHLFGVGQDAIWSTACIEMKIIRWGKKYHPCVKRTIVRYEKLRFGLQFLYTTWFCCVQCNRWCSRVVSISGSQGVLYASRATLSVRRTRTSLKTPGHSYASKNFQCFQRGSVSILH